MFFNNLRHISKDNNIKEMCIVNVINSFPGNLKEKADIKQDVADTSI